MNEKRIRARERTNTERKGRKRKRIWRERERERGLTGGPREKRLRLVVAAGVEMY